MLVVSSPAILEQLLKRVQSVGCVDRQPWNVLVLFPLMIPMQGENISLKVRIVRVVLDNQVQHYGSIPQLVFLDDSNDFRSAQGNLLLRG